MAIVKYIETTKPRKQRTITLTDARPVRIYEDEWPVIASSSWHSGEHESQANETATIRVRQHADGRVIVYSVHDSGPGGMPIGWRGSASGVQIGRAGEPPSDAQIVAAIRACDPLPGLRLAANCIADLPAAVL